MQKPDNTARLTAVFVFIAGVSATGLLIPRHHGFMLLMAYFSTFFGYFWLGRSQLNFTQWMTLGVLARLILFLGMPTLSDDVYRFIWDGYLMGNGVSPFQKLPIVYLEQNIPGINQVLFDHLNSQPYFTVYPPLNQWLFWLATSLSDSWLFQTNVFRFFLVVADLVSVYFLITLLKLYKLAEKNALWFFLNPLLILEATGNIHFEGFVICFLLMGIYFLEKNKWLSSALGFGLAIATKLLPLIYLPAVFFKKPDLKHLMITGGAVIIAVLTFLPFIASGAFDGMQSSLGLYFQKFEFNASIYFIIREIGFWYKGYNIIGTLGPWLSIFSGIGIILIAIFGRIKNWPLPKTMLFALSFYLLMATTVHPWYILPLLALGLLSGYFFPLIWSLMIFVTYFGYTDKGFELSFFWIVLEYVVVILTFIFEVYFSYDKTR